MSDSLLRSISLSCLVWINALREVRDRGDSEMIDKVVDLCTSIRALLPDQDHEVPDTNELWRLQDQEMELLHRRIHVLPDREWYHTQIRVIEELQRRIREQCKS